MTVAALPAVVEYVENGVSKLFPVPFRFKAAADLFVDRVVNGNATLLQPGTDYSVTGGETDAGGTLTRTVASNGGLLRIRRRTVRAQPMVYTTGDRFPAASHEAALDRAMLIAQEQDDQQADMSRRAIFAPAGETMGDLPPRSERAGRYLGFGADPSRPLALDAPGGADAALRRDLANPARGGALIAVRPPVTGAISRALDKTLADYEITPQQFGASGDGLTDDSAAIATALNSGFSVRLTDGKTYSLRRKVELTRPGITISGGGKIKIALDYDRTSDVDGGGWHMRAFFVLAPNVSFIGVTMDAAGVDLTEAGVENGFVWSRAAYTTVSGCQFIGLSKGTCIWSLGDAPYLSVTGCKSTNCSGLVFGRGRNGLASDNIIINATDAAIAINARVCTGWVIANNTINNEALAIIPAMIAVEEGASGWVITGNNLYGCNGGGINCINVLDTTAVVGGVITSNYIQAATFDGVRPVTTNPAAMLSMTGAYRNVEIRNNVINGVPAGPPNCRAVVLAAIGVVFEGNTIDVSTSPGMDAIIDVIAGDSGLIFRNNKITGYAGARHVLFNAGNYNNYPCRFEGGDFQVGNVAIDTDLFAGNIINLPLVIRNLARVTTVQVTACFGAIGDRSTFLNEDAVKYPHNIDERTVMFTPRTPVTPGARPFVNGDRFEYIDPIAAGATFVVRGAGGSEPERWRKYGGPVA